MGFLILFSVDKTRLSVAPGASVELVVTVQNLTALLDQVAVHLEGIDPTWVEVIPRYLPVFAQGQATARVIIRPPRDPAQSLAGLYPIRVRGTSQANPGQEGEAQTELEIQLIGDYRLLLEKGEISDVQEASYPIKVQNTANAPLQLHFSANDTEEALWYKFDPFQPVAPPGGEATATLTVKARRTTTDQRTIPFNLVAQGNFILKGGAQVAAPARQVPGQFVQLPLLPLTISVHPPQAQDAARTTYEVRVGNPGSAPVTLRLAGADEESALDFQFEPAQLTLAPQAESRATLLVRLKAQPALSEPREKSFRVTALPINSQAQPVSAQAIFVVTAPQAPSREQFPWWIVVGGLVLVAILIIAILVVTSVR